MADPGSNSPAFPPNAGWVADDPTSRGMTIGQYAAIKLRVPKSGCGWLDEMITESLRNEFAAAALTMLPSNTLTLVTLTKKDDDRKKEVASILGKSAYLVADAMLKARQA